MQYTTIDGDLVGPAMMEKPDGKVETVNYEQKPGSSTPLNTNEPNAHERLNDQLKTLLQVESEAAE